MASTDCSTASQQITAKKKKKRKEGEKIVQMEMNHDLSQSGNSPVIFITQDSLEVSGHVFVLFCFPQ